MKKAESESNSESMAINFTSMYSVYNEKLSENREVKKKFITLSLFNQAEIKLIVIKSKFDSTQLFHFSRTLPFKSKLISLVLTIK